MTAYLKHTDIYTDGIQPAEYVLRDFLKIIFSILIAVFI
jgi:hypothetical protein